MEKTTILKASDYMYNGYDFERPLNTIDLNNKLFCTFVDEEFIDERIQSISQSYDIMYNKMFVLFINALNTLIKSLNGGVVDPRFKVDWQHYRNCVLLTQQNDIRQLNTKVHKIIEL
mgnify:CR=1 FL=1